MADPHPAPHPVRRASSALADGRGSRDGLGAAGTPATDGLARCGDLEARRTGRAGDRLIVAARRLVRATGHHPDHLACASAGCALARHAALADGDEVCRLAHTLALLPLEHGPEPAVDPSGVGRPSDGGRPSLHALVTDFLATITAAVEAVQRCRRTAHAHGQCRFSSVAGQDGCAPILRAAHRLG